MTVMIECYMRDLECSISWAVHTLKVMSYLEDSLLYKKTSFCFKNIDVFLWSKCNNSDLTTLITHRTLTS